MAPLPDNTTSRYFIDYSTAVAAHTLEVRVNLTTADQADFDDYMDLWFSAIAPALYQRTITAVRYQLLGTEFSFPVSSALVGSSYGAGPADNIGDAKFLRFVGRTAGGRRSGATLFGVVVGTPEDFRLTTNDNSAVLGAVINMNDANNIWLGIDGNPPVWYPYANVGYNAYWQREHRS